MISKAERTAGRIAETPAANQERPARVPDPPRPHRWFLVLTIVLLAIWMVFLAFLALRPS